MLPIKFRLNQNRSVLLVRKTLRDFLIKQDDESTRISRKGPWTAAPANARGQEVGAVAEVLPALVEAFRRNGWSIMENIL